MVRFASYDPHTINLEQLGDDIAEVAAHLHAATYRLLVCLREFDERGGWGRGFKELRALAELAHGDRAGCGTREGARRACAGRAAAVE